MSLFGGGGGGGGGQQQAAPAPAPIIIPAPDPIIIPAPSVDVPKEDPQVKEARVRAQAKADAQLTSAIQDNLRNKMQSRLQRFGLVPTDARGSISSGFLTSI